MRLCFITVALIAVVSASPVGDLHRLQRQLEEDVSQLASGLQSSQVLEEEDVCDGIPANDQCEPFRASRKSWKYIASGSFGDVFLASENSGFVIKAFRAVDDLKSELAAFEKLDYTYASSDTVDAFVTDRACKNVLNVLYRCCYPSKVGDVPQFFTVMPYVGYSSHDLVNIISYTPEGKQMYDGAPMPPCALGNFLLQSLAGLVCLAHNDAVHVDIKPLNININPENGDVQLIDLGEVQGTGFRQIRGTLGYIAPEVLRGESLTPQSDIFSLGATLIELSTGGEIYPSTCSKVRSMPMTFQRCACQGYLQQLVGFESKCVDPDPAVPDSERFDLSRTETWDPDVRNAIFEYFNEARSPFAAKLLPLILNMLASRLTRTRDELTHFRPINAESLHATVVTMMNRNKHECGADHGRSHLKQWAMERATIRQNSVTTKPARAIAAAIKEKVSLGPKSIGSISGTFIRHDEEPAGTFVKIDDDEADSGTFRVVRDDDGPTGSMIVKGTGSNDAVLADVIKRWNF